MLQTYEEHKALSENLKSELQSIRNVFQNRIQEPLQQAIQFPAERKNLETSHITDFKASMTGVSVECTQRMLQFSGRIMSESVKLLTIKPPCPFTVVAIGSMARGEATPYSDLEYIFLIEEKTQETLSYFRSMAITSYFLIGNLRETKLSYMDVDELKPWFDDCSKNGFKIDGLASGAGNIPTGRGTPETENKFIKTPEDLLRQYADVYANPVIEQAKRGDVTAMLSYMSPIYSHGVGPEKLLRTLKERLRNVSKNAEREKANFEMLWNDISKFNFKPDGDISVNGYTINIKRQIFRFPSILILDLAIVYKICGESSWETLYALEEQKAISPSVREKLQFLLSCACFIRLSAYLDHDSHDDRMSVALESVKSDGVEQQNSRNRDSNQNMLKQRWFVPFGLFLAMCHVMIPLKEQLQKAGDLVALGSGVGTDVLSTWSLELKVFLCCGRVADAMNIVSLHFGPEIITNTRRCIQQIECSRQELSDVAVTLLEKSYYEAAVEVFMEISARDTLTHKESLCLARGQMYWVKARESQDVLEKLPDKTGDVHFWLGRAFAIQGNYEAAEHNYLLALNHFHRLASHDRLYDYYGEPIPLEKSERFEETDLVPMSANERLNMISHGDSGVIISLARLGSNYKKRGMISESVSYCLKAVELAEQFYGENAVNHDMITVCMVLTSAYNSQEMFDRSKYYSLKNLRMTTQLYDGKDSMAIASALNNAGCSCFKLKQYDEALDYTIKARDMLVSLRLHDTKAMASKLSSLGWIYEGRGQFLKALQSVQEAKDIYAKINPHHEKISVLEKRCCVIYKEMETELQMPTKCCYPAIR